MSNSTDHNADVQALLTAVKTEDSELIDSAAEQVIVANQQQTAVPLIAQLLNDTQQELFVRIQAASALKLLEDITAVPHLGQALQNQNNKVVIRRVSLGSLERLDPIGSMTFFRQVVENKSDPLQKEVLVSLGLAVQALRTQELAQARTALTTAQIAPKHLTPLLDHVVLNWEPGITPVPAAAAEVLGFLGESEAIDIICRLLQKLQQEQLQNDAQGSNESDGLSDARQLEQAGIKESIMISAVTGLRHIGLPAIVPCLADVLAKNLNYRVRRLAANTMGRLGFNECIEPLANAMLSDSNRSIQEMAHASLVRIADWREKATQIIDLLRAGAEQREQLDTQLIVSAMQPPQTELDDAPHLLTDFLIDTAVKNLNNKRLLRILTTLININANHNTDEISERIDHYRDQDKSVTTEQLQPLRVEIGGAETLKPVLARLEENLQKYFQDPIDDLNQDTSRVWKRTIFLANSGFVVRIFLNVAIFAIGAFLVLHSYLRMASGQLSPQQVTAVWAAFIGGGATMFTTFFTFPLQQIKRAVSDVGLANVAFIAFVHRVLQVSHTFSYFYLEGDISFESLENAGKLIEDTSTDTILILNISGSESDQDQLSQVLLTRLQGTPAPSTNDKTPSNS